MKSKSIVYEITAGGLETTAAKSELDGYVLELVAMGYPLEQISVKLIEVKVEEIKLPLWAATPEFANHPINTPAYHGPNVEA